MSANVYASSPEQHVVQQARALQLLDYTSYYTALLRGVDPAEIEAVAGLKAFLRQPATNLQAPQPSRGPLPGKRPMPRVAPSVAHILRTLDGQQPMTLADLCARSGLPRRTTSGALRVLRERGQLRQQPSLRDTRQTYFWLAGTDQPTQVGVSTSEP